MLEIACYTIALTVAAWAVWVRRVTWCISWERSTTYAIIQLALALVLIAPASEPVIGRLLFEVFGKWHLDNMLANMLELGALVSCASLAVSAGVNVLALARMLGHKDPSVTLRVYADLFDTDLDAVAASLHSRYSPKKCAQNVLTERS